MPRRPRSPVSLRYRTPPRDVEVLALVAECGTVTQPAVSFALFQDRAKSVASEAVRRLHDRGLLTIDRSHRTAVNLLSITPAGRDLLVARDRLRSERIFVPTKELSPSIFRHAITIADCIAVLRRIEPKPSLVLSASAVQRLMPDLAAVPDLLLGYRRGSVDAFSVIEIDCGTEGEPVLIDKFRRLGRVLAEFSGGAVASILVLTTDSDRVRRIERLVPPEIPSLVQLLPRSAGDHDALEHLAKVFGVPQTPNSHPERESGVSA